MMFQAQKNTGQGRGLSRAAQHAVSKTNTNSTMCHTRKNTDQAGAKLLRLLVGAFTAESLSRHRMLCLTANITVLVWQSCKE